MNRRLRLASSVNFTGIVSLVTDVSLLIDGGFIVQ